MLIRLSLSFGNFVTFGSNWSNLLGFGLILVQLHEFGKIELGFLEDFNLSDHAVVLEWEDFAALFLNLFANVFFNTIKY